MQTKRTRIGTHAPTCPGAELEQDGEFIRCANCGRDLEEISLASSGALFSVYWSGGEARFPSQNEAYAWARSVHAVSGGTFECRDENFDHVFTVED